MAYVDINGAVRANKKGTATITASAGGVSASCEVRVIGSYETEFKLLETPNTVRCYPAPRAYGFSGTYGIDYCPDDPVTGGTLRITGVDLPDQDEVVKKFTVHATVTSVEDDKFLPYIKWVAEDAQGNVVDSGLTCGYNRTVGDTLDIACYISGTTPGQSYTIRILSD